MGKRWLSITIQLIWAYLVLICAFLGILAVGLLVELGIFEGIWKELGVLGYFKHFSGINECEELFNFACVVSCINVT